MHDSHDSLGATPLRIRQFENSWRLARVVISRRAAPRAARHGSRGGFETVERDPGDSGEQEGRPTMSVIWHATELTRLGTR